MAAADSFLSSRLQVSLSLVDNSPTDQLREIISGTAANYIFSGLNLGFGAGHNVAIRKYLSTAEYHLVLNPDVYFDPEIIVSLYNFMQANPRVGMVMPRVLYPDGKEQHLCKLLPSPTDLIARRFGGRIGAGIFRSRVARYLLHGIRFDEPTIVPCLSGCFMLIRTEVLKKVGAFDERYFMYMEDVDLCRRVGEVSYTVFYPGVTIFHEYAKGSYSSSRLLRYHVTSAWRYFSRWGWIRDESGDRLNERLCNPSESRFVCDAQETGFGPPEQTPDLYRQGYDRNTDLH